MTKVKIACATDLGPRCVELREVEAVVFGEWAATRAPVTGQRWSVTHVDSGRSLSVSDRSTFLRAEAVHIANRLHGAVPPIADWQAIPADVAKLIKQTAADALAEVAP